MLTKHIFHSLEQAEKFRDEYKDFFRGIVPKGNEYWVYVESSNEIPADPNEN